MCVPRFAASVTCVCPPPEPLLCSQGKHHGCRQSGKAGGKAKRKHYKKTVLNLRKRVPDIDQIQVRAAWEVHLAPLPD